MAPGVDESFKAWNDRMAAKHDPERLTAQATRLVLWLKQARIRRVFALLQATTQPVLEVGCGAGYLLAAAPTRHVGVDLAGPLLAKAARRLGSARGLVQADAHDLPFRTSGWTRIYCSEVLEHVADPQRVVRELARLSKPGGLVVITVPNDRLINAAKRVLGALGVWRWLLGGVADRYATSCDEWHVRVFRLRDLLSLCPPRLRVTRVEGIPTRWCPIQWIVRCEAVG